MFDKKRPVPSAAALRVLTQLAYISSGTALGAAALCAEERRRRIKLVQKLADNARVIRQHPRHVSNVALAVNDNGDTGIEGFFGSGGWSPEAVRRKSRRLRGGPQSELNETRDEGVKGPALPSVVEEGYSETVARQDASPTDGTARPERISASTHYGTNRGTTSSIAVDTGDDRFGNAGRQISNVNRIQQSTVLTPLEKTTPKHENTLFRTMRKGPRGRLFHEPPKTIAKPTETSVSVGSTYLTAFAWRGRESLSSDPLLSNDESPQVSGDHITHDVELFFAGEAELTLTDKSMTNRAHVTTQLLILALEKGFLDDIRSICFWKLANGSFDKWHIDLVTKSYATLASRIEQEDLFDFYCDLFSSGAFKKLSCREQFRRQLLVLGAAASSHVNIPVKILATRLVGKSAQSLTAHEVRSCLQSMCQSLLENGSFTQAARLFIMFDRARDLFFRVFPTNKAFDGLADMIFDKCVTNGQLSAAGRVLSWKHRELSAILQKRDVLQLQDFIAACGVQDAHKVLLDVFFLGPRHINARINVLVRYLDRSSRATLARACSQDPRCRHSFNALHNSLPLAAQHTLNEQTSTARLLTKWQSTRDLPAVEAEAAILKHWLGHAKDGQAMKRIDKTMLEIYISAGKTDEALTALSRMRNVEGIDGHTWSLAGLLFAKRRAWEHLARLLKISESSQLTKIDFEFMRIWDKVVLLYSEKHTVEQTLKFVSDSVSSVGFQPTIITGRILLQSCVNSRSLDVIPTCLDYLESVGRQINLTSRVVAGMMTTYWIKTRPKHKRLIWLCHFLHRHVPSFRAIDFKDLLKEAIGYDLRNPYEQDLSSKNPVEHVMARLARLEGTTGMIPIPGWTEPSGDNRLSFTREHGLFSGSVVRYLAAKDEEPVGSGEFEVDPSAEPPAVQGSGKIKGKDDFEPTSALDLALGVPWGVDLGDKSGQMVHQARNDIFGYDDIKDTKLSSKHAARPPGVAPETTEEQYHAMIAAFNTDEADVAVSQSGQKDDTNTSDHGQVERPKGSFNHVRPNVKSFGSINNELQYPNSSVPSRRERGMVLALSTGEYERVLQLYRDTLGPTGLPASVRSLEIATEAALRLHFGNPTEAEALLARASKAGMNVTCAMGPLIVHRMRHMSRSRKIDANHLRVTVMDFYRMNDRHGWPVSHHIATTAAHLLITNNCPEHGINLLTAVYTSEWIAERTLDIVAMTVFLMGYNDLKSLPGIQWVVNQVLSNELRISRSFMRELKRSYTLPGETLSKSWRVKTRFTDQEDRATLMRWADVCYRRRLDQLRENHQFGMQLEATIKACAKKQGLKVRTSEDESRTYQALMRADLESEDREAATEPDDWVDGVSDYRLGSGLVHGEADVDGEEGEMMEEDVATPHTPFAKEAEDAPTAARPETELPVDDRKIRSYASEMDGSRSPPASKGRKWLGEDEVASYTPFV